VGGTPALRLGEGIKIPCSKNMTRLETEQTPSYLGIFFGTKYAMGNGHEFWNMKYDEPELVRDIFKTLDKERNIKIRFIGNTGGFIGQGSH